MNVGLTLRCMEGVLRSPPPLLYFVALYSKYLKIPGLSKLFFAGAHMIKKSEKNSLLVHFEIWVWKSPMKNRVKEFLTRIMDECV